MHPPLLVGAWQERSPGGHGNLEVLNIRYMIIRNNRTIFKTLLGYQLYSGSDLAITREDPGILESVCVCGGGGLQGP